MAPVATQQPQPKRHHYVPRMLQKRFVTDDGKLFAYDCRTPEREIFPVKPDELMLQGHLYSEVADDNTKDASLELDFAKLESAADPIVERMVDDVRKGKLPALGAADLNRWIEFFIQQIRRVPDNFDGLITVERMREVLVAEIPKLRAVGHKIAAEAEAEFLGDKYLKRQIQNIRILNLRGWGAWLKVAERNRQLSFAHIPNPKKSFVLASSPVGRLSPGIFIASPHAVMQSWLPIAPDVACAIHGQESEPQIVAASTEQVRVLNETLAKQSTIVSGRSEKLVASLSKLAGTAKVSREMLYKLAAR